MLKKLGIVAGLLVALLVILAVIVAVQPADFSVQRSTTIAAPPATVFGLVNDFHQWDKWSPWAKLDPAMKTTFEGPASGEGAIYTWSGNSDVGEGLHELGVHGFSFGRGLIMDHVFSAR